MDKDGKLIINLQRKLERWTEYIQQSFDDNRTTKSTTETRNSNITTKKIIHALENIKNNKAHEPDEVSYRSS